MRRFAFRLAARLGCTVAELYGRVDPREFVEWMAFDRIEPIGDERLDLLNGIACSLFANANRGKGRPAFKPKDFMPQYGRPRRQSQAEIRSRLMAFAKMHNAQQGKRRS